MSFLETGLTVQQNLLVNEMLGLQARHSTSANKKVKLHVDEIVVPETTDLFQFKLSDTTFEDGINGNDFVRDMSKKTMAISKIMTIQEVIQFTDAIFQEIKSILYGIMVVDTSTDRKFNLLHPLVAQYMIKTYEREALQGARKYKLYVFYREPKSADDIKVNEELVVEETTKLLNLINKLTWGTATETSTLETASRRNKEDLRRDLISGYNSLSVVNASIGVTKSMSIDGTTHNTMYIAVPNQLIVSGLAVPYYGISLSKLEDKARPKGHHFNVMTSANVHPIEHNVCTGSEDNTTFEGHKTLNKVNMGSPYNRTPIYKGWESVAYAYLNYSLTLFKGYFNGNS